MADLSTWIPKLLIDDVNDLGGTPITDEAWNNLWKRHRVQGDDTANTLKELIDEWYSTFWHGTDAAQFLTNPAIYADGSLNLHGQLLELVDHMDDAELRLDTLETNMLGYRPLSTALVHNTDISLASRASADCHPMSAITGLETALYNITVGEVNSFFHNAIGYRDAADAHPMAAITNLESTLSSILGDINTINGQLLDLGLDCTDITYDESNTLLQKLTNMDAIIAGLSGGTISINHADVLLRDAADSHPMTAITGLTAALAGKQDTIADITPTEFSYLSGVTSAIQTQLNNKQTKITASTSAPTGGNDGDVWIVYG